MVAQKEDIYHEVSQSLREYRRRHKLSQAEMAERLGTSRTNLSKFEIGRGGLNKETFARVCRLVGVGVVGCQDECLSKERAARDFDPLQLVDALTVARSMVTDVERDPVARLAVIGALLDCVIGRLKPGL